MIPSVPMSVHDISLYYSKIDMLMPQRMHIPAKDDLVLTCSGVTRHGHRLGNDRDA